MWAIQNKTPYAAERTWIQDKDGNKVWLVVVKATYDILPDGLTRLAEQQEPPLRSTKHQGEPGESSLLYDTDMGGIKASTDVVINGTAYAPGGRLVKSVDVQFTLGSITKRLRVFGDRVWKGNLLGGPSISSPQPFESMPIRYERAFGGWDRVADDPKDHRLDPRNPIGTGFAVRVAHSIGANLPNIEYPNRLIGSWKDRPAPAGLGPIECHWSPRRELAGTYDDKWRRERFPLWAEDFNARYHNSAPVDQQVAGFLRGGESAELVNLTPSSRMRFVLPRVYPFFRTQFGPERVEHRAQLCTVIIEPDHLRVIMVWQTSLPCNHRVDDLDGTTVTEKRMV
jgi:hypothetical protein